jgi:hypothetical protein
VNVSIDMTVLDPGIAMTAISARILYDPSVFSYDDTWEVTQGSMLEHNWDPWAATPAAGELRIAAIDWDFFEEDIAAGSGTLFTFKLKVKDDALAGPSMLTWGVYDGHDNSLAGFDYGDADFSDAILLDSNMHGASINVSGPAVPEPMSVVLAVMGVASVIGFKRLRRK